MKPFVINIFAVLFWVVVGHFFSSFSISLTAFYFPILFVVLDLTIGKGTNKYVYTLVCFVLILVHDYLFRLYGGGTHDEVGKAICEIVFYATLTTSTIALLFLKIIDNYRRPELNPENKSSLQKIMLDIVFVLALSIATLLFFRKFNVYIN